MHKNIKPSLNNIFGISDSNHVICTLHAKQRIVERLIMLLTGGITSETLKVVERISCLKSLNRFNITLKESTENTFNDVKVNMLTGDQCDTILKNYRVVIGADSSTKLRLIWKQTSQIIYEYLEATIEELEKKIFLN